MFHSLGRLAHRRRRLMIAIWAAVLLAGMALSATVMSRLTAHPEGGTRLESLRVAERLADLSGHGPSVVAVVDGPAGDPALRREVEAATVDLTQDTAVVMVTDHYGTGSPALVATDGGATLVIVELAKGRPAGEHDAVTTRVAERLRAIDGADVTIGGSAVIDHEFAEAIEKDLAAEQKALPVAFVVMVVILGGLIAAGLPLLIAFGAVAGSMFVLMAATGATDVSVYALNVVFMFGLGLGIDYGLLLVSRFREERAAGADIARAVEVTVATAGRTVAFSALTVAAALAGLFAFPDPTFRSFGIAGMGVVAMAMASSLTLLPALLAVFGRRIKPAPARRDGHRFAAIARFVQRRAVPVVLVVGVGLAALAIPFLSARFETGDARWLPRSSEARAVAIALTDRFPARGADPVLIAADVDHADPRVDAYVQRLQGHPAVAGAELWHDTPAGTTVIAAVPHGPSQGETAQALVRDLRAQRPDFPAEVGGTAATLIDTKDDTAARLPYALGIIATATFVLLFLMTGSIAVPVKAIVMNVLSLGASFGALVWGFQDGHLAGLLGFEPVGSLDLFMPVLIFIFAFGLSMDYEVFLLGRIKEIYDQTGDNDHAVAAGLQRTGGIVTSAALLIVVVFAGFALGEVLGIKMLGFGLALAVVVDATIVRTLLVPATMKLLGGWNWWAPAPLRRIHQRFGLHEAPSAPTLPAAEPVLEPATA
jgi:putative drug exporter of the RND superfamily